ncbi:MAG: hypothetical protein VKJ86_10640 [Synechococcus sp.]|nr:hypothetical protein [Synechococcus sp.]
MPRSPKPLPQTFLLFLLTLGQWFLGLGKRLGRSPFFSHFRQPQRQNLATAQTPKIRPKIKVKKVGRSLLYGIASFILTISLSGLPLWFPLPAPAQSGGLYIEPITFDAIGLDSNNVNVGPNDYLSGARVCNISGQTLNNITVQFVRLGATNNFISVTALGSNTDTLTIASLPTGSTPPNFNNNAFIDSGISNITPANCYNAYFNVVIQRTPAAYNTFQQYKIEARASGVTTVDTNQRVAELFPGSNGVQQLYVEKILSQARNSVVSFTGPSTVFVGQSYEYTLVTKTATGYPQLTISTDFPNAVFEFTDVKTTYSSDPGVYTASVYNDACGWIRPPDVLGYRASSSNCSGPIPNQDVGDGKVGNTVTTRYRIKVLGTPVPGGGTIQVNHLILDFSGGSYHYNADFGIGLGAFAITVLESPDVAITKTATAPFPAGGIGSYTLTLDNTTSVATTGGLTVTDTLPPGTAFQSFSAAPGFTWTCRNALNQTCAPGDIGPFTFTTPSNLTGNASTTLTLNVFLPTTAGNIINRATVSTTNDLNPNNNAAEITTSVIAAPDLAITKTGPIGVAQGQTVIYTLRVQNVGTASTSGQITITDTLPTGLVPNATAIANANTSNGWTCATSGQTVTCTRTNSADVFAVNANLPNILITVDVAANATPGNVVNTATIQTGSGGDINTTNNTATLPIAIGSFPDLTIAKTSSPASIFTKGGTATYTLTITNVGSGATNGSLISVIEALPTGIAIDTTNTTYTNNGWSCNPSPVSPTTTASAIPGNFTQVITCTNSTNLAPTGTSTLTIPVKISSNAVTGSDQSFTNRAFVDVTGDPNPTNDETELKTFTGPDVTIQKTALGSFASGSTNAQYSITVTNVGGSMTTGRITFNDVIDDNRVSYTGPDTLPSGWTCSTPITPTPTGTTPDFNCTNPNPNLEPGSSITIIVNVSISSGVALTVQNTVTIDATNNNGGDTNPNNNSSSTITGTGDKPDLTVSKTLTQTGSTGSYVVKVRNEPTASASTDNSLTTVTTMTDTLPLGVNATGVTFSSQVGSDQWSCTITNNAPVSNSVISCTQRDIVAVGNFFEDIIIAVTGFPTSGSFTNTAVVQYGNSDGRDEINTSNNSFSLTTAPPDLTIFKTGPSTVRRGGSAVYELRVFNAGSTATNPGNVFVTDTLPSGLTAISATGTGWTCSIPTTQTISCNRSNSLAPDLFYPSIFIEVSVAENATLGDVVNIAQVTGTNVFSANPISSGVGDPTVAGGETNTTNNRKSLSISILGVPDLTIEKTGPASFTQSSTGTYTLTVRNIGSAATSGTITVTDTLPTGVTPNFTNPYTNNGWTCNATGQVVICTNNVVLAATNGSSAFVLPVNISSTAPASVTNNVSVQGEGELRTDNNTASLTTPINARPDLTIVKTHIGDFQQGQVGAIYTLQVVNIGSAPTNGTSPIQVIDTLPVGLTPTEASGTGWSCNISGQTVICDRQNVSTVLPGGFNVYPEITLSVNVASNASSPLVNTATVRGSAGTPEAGGETNIANNSDSDSTTIISIPDLAITKIANDPFDAGQTNATYTLRVQNVSNNALASGNVVTVTDTVPLDLKILSAAGTGWTCGAPSPANTFGNSVSCTRNDGLAAESLYQDITLTVEVSPTARLEFANTAIVSTPPDTNLANNSDTEPTLINQVDLAIIKTAPATLTQGQTGAQYTLTVYNLGGLAKPDGTTVTVTDVLPSELTPTAASGGGWNCNTLGQTVTCTRTDSLAADPTFGPDPNDPESNPFTGDEPQYPPITITVNVAANATVVTNVAEVSDGPGGDINTSNDSFLVTTIISPNVGGPPNLLLVKRITAINDVPNSSLNNDGISNSADDDPKWPSEYLLGALSAGAAPGDTVEYTIYFLNKGNSAASNVKICDPLSQYLDYIPNSYGSAPDLGIKLDLSETSTNLTGIADSDAGQFINPGFVPTGCVQPASLIPMTAADNVNGTIRVELSSVANATSAGTPNSYGYIRFRARVK